MRCEVCGQSIGGKPHKVIIEGAKLIVCDDCAKLGSEDWKIEPKKAYSTPIKSYKPTRRLTSTSKTPLSQTLEELELTEDYGQRIRQARENLGLSHKDLGRKIGEKVSVLQKLETGKMVPNQLLTRKLEHTLKIRLFVPSRHLMVNEKDVTQKPFELTLGDIVTVKKRKRKWED